MNQDNLNWESQVKKELIELKKELDENVEVKEKPLSAIRKK